jgi:hypothetical protein
MWVWVDDRGQPQAALHPVPGAECKLVELPQNPKYVLELLARCRGAVRHLTGMDDAEEARIALKKTVDVKRHAEPEQDTSSWRAEPLTERPPVDGKSNSIRTVSGGLPTLGRRRR